MRRDRTLGMGMFLLGIDVHLATGCLGRRRGLHPIGSRRMRQHAHRDVRAIHSMLRDSGFVPALGDGHGALQGTLGRIGDQLRSPQLRQQDGVLDRYERLSGGHSSRCLHRRRERHGQLAGDVQRLLGPVSITRRLESATARVAHLADLRAARVGDDSSRSHRGWRGGRAVRGYYDPAGSRPTHTISGRTSSFRWQLPGLLVEIVRSLAHVLRAASSR